MHDVTSRTLAASGIWVGYGIAMACCQASASPPATLESSPVGTLPGIVVSGERQIGGTPASVDRIVADDVPASARISVSEWLRRVPGVAAHDRQNLAQDVQLTIRGFGARSTFGVRGLRIFVDDIPATMPDGQGQVSHVPLDALARVEVLRGPFSALYGNASGGVIAFFSAPPSAVPTIGFRVAGGDNGLRETALSFAGPWGGQAGGGLRLDAARLDLDGYRRHSNAQRETGQARLVSTTRSGAKLALTVNALSLRAQDPQGLTHEQALADPRAASAPALAFDTRKRVRQQQVGLHIAQPLGDKAVLTVSGWGGTRATFQALSVPVTAQRTPGSGGGIVDLGRAYSGADVHWRIDGALGGRHASLTLGVDAEQSREHRRGYENFVGTQLGVVGALRRDQRDAVDSRDIYGEAQWAFGQRWTATLGARSSHIRFDSHDAYIAPGNGDDSGRRDFRMTTPMAGLLYRPTAHLELYANAGRGFETPSLAELGYRSDGRSGFNDALQPATSDNGELGLRAQHGDQRLTLAAFASRTHDELVVASNTGGRSTYANAATSDRRGWELSAHGPLSDRWHYALAYSALSARYRDGFSTCRAPPCTQPDTRVPAGNRIPATAPQAAWAELRFAPHEGLEVFAQVQAVGRLYADDANTAFAAGHAALDLGVERSWHRGPADVQAFARVDNLLNRHAIDSVIVNDANGRYFEPAPGRGWWIGVSVQARQLR